MAPGLSELVTTTLRNRTKILKDNVTNNNAAFAKMKEHGSFEAVSGGRTLIEEMAYDENDSFLYYSGAEVLNTSYNETMTAAEFDWKQAAVSVVMSGLEERQNSGPEGVIKLLSSRVKIAEDTMMNKLNASLYSDGTGFGGKEIGGLDLLVAKTPTNTVGGINRSTAAGTFYRNYSLAVVATYGVAMSAANCKEVFTRAKINTTRNTDVPNLGLLGNSYYEYIMTASQAIQRLEDPKLAKLGFENIVFCGIPMCLGGGKNFGGETLIGATDSYLLNTKYVKLKYHKDCFMDPLEERLSINQDALVKYIAFMGNMTLSNGGLQARVYDS